MQSHSTDETMVIDPRNFSDFKTNRLLSFILAYQVSAIKSQAQQEAEDIKMLAVETKKLEELRLLLQEEVQENVQDDIRTLIQKKIENIKELQIETTQPASLQFIL